MYMCLPQLLPQLRPNANMDDVRTINDIIAKAIHDEYEENYSFLSKQGVRFLLFKRVTDSPFNLHEMVKTALGKPVFDYLKAKKFTFKVDASKLPSGRDVFAIAVNHHNDHVMIKAAHEHGIARGFKIVCTADAVLGVMGFYPKFENDYNRTVQVSVPEETTRIEFFKKYSGYLGMLGCFELDGEVFAVAGSKKSTSNSFAVDCSRLCAEWLTLDAARELAGCGMTLSFEVMSKFDQTHGARVIGESTILTCVSTHNGHLNVLGEKECLFAYHKLEDVRKLGLRINAPVANLFVSENVESIRKFSILLHEAKNYASNREFNALCEEAGIEVLPGNTNHELVLGNVLEGIVAKFILADGRVETLKLKLVSYIIRTMALRSALNPGPCHRLSSDSSPFALRLFFEQIISNWTTEPKATEYWIEVCMRAYTLAKTLPSYPSNTTPRDFFTDTVGPHILAVDEIVSEFTPNDFQPSQSVEKTDEPHKFTLFVVTGPIGSGKTTFSEWLSVMLGVEHIDGDKLPDFEDLTLQLGPERSSATLTTIFNALSRRKVVVFSTGGGILLGSRGMSNIRTFLRNLGVCGLRIVHCGVSSAVDNIQICDDSAMAGFIQSYDDHESVSDAVRRRVDADEWTIPSRFKTVDGFVDFIVKRSRDNGSLQKKLFSLSDASYVVPYSPGGVVPESLSGSDTLALLTPHLPMDSSSSDTESQTIKPTQVRLIVIVDGSIHHITVNYCSAGIEMTTDDLAILETYVGRCFDGQLISCGPHKFVVVDGLTLSVRDAEYGCSTAHVTVATPRGYAPVQSLYKTIMFRRYGIVPNSLKVVLTPETIDTFDGPTHQPRLTPTTVKVLSVGLFA